MKSRMTSSNDWKLKSADCRAWSVFCRLTRTGIYTHHDVFVARCSWAVGVMVIEVLELS